jgi:hypothetical protein
MGLKLKSRDIIVMMEKIPNEELHNSHSSPHIVRVASSRRMRWTGAVLSAGVLMVDGGEV